MAPPASDAPATSQPAPPTFAEALRVWFQIGLLSFGGPAGQIALMHRLIVEQRRWIREEQFLHALNFCMLLPGPEAQQLATYVGWLLHGVRGGLAAGVLFVLPGAAVILALSVLYASYQTVPLLQAVFLGVKAAVLIIVVEAVLRIGRKVLKNATMVAIAILAFTGIFFFALPFPLIVIAAALIGFTGARVARSRFLVIRGANEGTTDTVASAQSPSPGRSASVLLVGVTLWALPVALAAVMLGSDHVFVDEGLFFSKLATVTFGGAYAVLAYMTQEAVGVYGWLSTGEMIDGLGLAESTPGPLIMVVQFVAFLGALRNPGPLDPMTAAVLGSAIAVWVTFVPCFIWIFLGAPYIERLRNNASLNAALSAITAAVVGVILNLAIWFGVHVLFLEVSIAKGYGFTVLSPSMDSLDVRALVLVSIAALALLKLKLGVVSTLVLCALLAVVTM